MFGGSASFGSPQQPPTSSVFGASPFGGGSGGFSQTSNATTSPPAFGSSFSQATSNAPGFGATPAFGSPVCMILNSGNIILKILNHFDFVLIY